MTVNEKIVPLGYQPKQTDIKGYQPQLFPTGDPKPQGGYQPTSTGDNPANNPSPPSPPGDE